MIRVDVPGAWTDAPPVPVELRPWKRPDGRWYRPRRVVVDRWEDGHDGRCGAVVLGTFDYAPAFEWASWFCRREFGSRVDWESGVDRWTRTGYAGRRGEVSWVEDPGRGRAAVFFTATMGW